MSPPQGGLFFVPGSAYLRRFLSGGWRALAGRCRSPSALGAVLDLLFNLLFNVLFNLALRSVGSLILLFDLLFDLALCFSFQKPAPPGAI